MGQVWHKSSGAGRLGQVWHESSGAGLLGFLVSLQFFSPKKSVVDRPGRGVNSETNFLLLFVFGNFLCRGGGGYHPYPNLLRNFSA